MATRILYFLCLTFGLVQVSAQNLVPNPSFEDYNECPEYVGFEGASQPLHWIRLRGSPDYYHSCAVLPLIQVPSNLAGSQYPMDGEGYIGLVVYGADGNREMVGCQLLDTLVVGTTYHLSFSVNCGERGWATHMPFLACNNLGLLLTTALWPTPSILPFEAAITLPNWASLNCNQIVTDTAEWTLVSGDFVADSAYTHLVLGNFFTDELTDTVSLLPEVYHNESYFLYDAICVSSGAVGCDFNTAMPEEMTKGVTLGPIPTEGELYVYGPATHLWLLDNIGREVWSAQQPFVSPTTIDLRKLPNGVYHMRINGKEGIVTKKVVVQH